jgi:hypothetical protein
MSHLSPEQIYSYHVPLAVVMLLLVIFFVTLESRRRR